MTVEATGARRYWLIWAAVIPIALWAVVRSFGLESGGQLTSLMWFTPYATIAALLVAGVALALRNWAAAAVAAVATVCLAVAVLPRAHRQRKPSRQPAMRPSRVLSANVELGGADPDALVALVDRYHPDLLSVQELTPSFARKLRRDGIYRRLPHSVLMAQPKGHGAGLYARFPLTALPHQTHFLFRMPRAMIVLPDGRHLRVVAVHPQPPNMSVDRWEEALESLPTPGAGIPWVLAGDFNATFDQAEFRELVDRGYRDAGAATGKGLEPTWPSARGFPWGLMTIDHVLADHRLGVAEYGVDGLPGSDHRAIHAELVLPNPSPGASRFGRPGPSACHPMNPSSSPLPIRLGRRGSGLERAALQEAIGEWVHGGIHHVGNTAIPGLEAKPIIDILAACAISNRPTSASTRSPGAAGLRRRAARRLRQAARLRPPGRAVRQRGPGPPRPRPHADDPAQRPLCAAVCEGWSWRRPERDAGSGAPARRRPSSVTPRTLAPATPRAPLLRSPAAFGPPDLCECDKASPSSRRPSSRRPHWSAAGASSFAAARRTARGRGASPAPSRRARCGSASSPSASPSPSSSSSSRCSRRSRS